MSENKSENKVKKILVASLLTVVAVGLGVFLSPKPKGVNGGRGEYVYTHKEYSDSSVLALVNGEKILWKTFANAVKDVDDCEKSCSNELENGVLNDLIDFELLYQEALECGVELSEGAGALRVDAVQRAQKDPSGFEEMLAESGLTREEYQKEWHRQVTVNVYIEDHIESIVEVDDATLLRLYNRLIKDNEEEPLPFEEAKPSLKTAYVKEKTKSLVDDKIAHLKGRADITIL